MFDYRDYFELANELENYNSIFYKFWSLGAPSFTKEIPTAAVTYDFKTDNVVFLLNEEFWNSLTLEQKCFVISHECMHIILNHFVRARKAYTKIKKDQVELQILNRAMDISINHGLVEKFGFDRNAIDPDSKYCWVDTVFDFVKDKYPNLPTDKNFEYYYLLLKKMLEDGDIKVQYIRGECVDSHTGGMESAENDPEGKGMKRIFDKLNDKTTDAERDSMKEFVLKDFKQGTESNGKEAGSVGGNMMRFADPKRVLKKKKWETIIHKWVKSKLRDSLKDEEQWIREHRRMAASMAHQDFFTPSEMEVEGLNKEKHKITVWFFLDTSGSCAHLGDRFFTAALSVPTDRFDIKLFCFDTKVYPTSLESKKLYGFGGTTFTCIERYIQANCEGKYPDCVWVVTDGYGDPVRPENADRWHWFLTENYTRCIPPESKKYDLKSFE